MLNFKRNGLMTLLLLGVLLFMGQQPVNAGTQKTTQVPKAEKATFMLMPELPANNIGGRRIGYFNLKVKKNQPQTVRIKVYNPTNQSLNVMGQVADATTNDNATVDYLGSHEINQRLLPTPGSQWVTVPKKTTLAPGETKRLKIKVAVKHNFEGVKATTINLSASQTNQKTAVKNTYRYAIGLILTGQKVPINHYQKLSSPKIKTRLTANHQAAISVLVKNPDPMYLKRTKIKVSLQNKKWSFVRYDRQFNNAKIAPNSQFYLDTLLGGKRLVPGVYQLTMTVKGDHYQQTLHQYVAISKSQAKYINQYNAAYLLRRNWIIGIGVFILILVVGIVVYRFHVIKKRKKEHHAEDGQ
ncbi:MAG: DUF916 and DUF3324 domain-containing protein [Bacillota bacterium]|nr:DUF916 and DUF3324 domain-containing protein [Bacillota bacterium]